MIARPALSYYGSKWRMAPRIIEQLPPHTTYIEVLYLSPRLQAMQTASWLFNPPGQPV